DSDVISELIQQFEDNNPGIPVASTVEVLASLANEVLGRSSETAKYLSAAHKHFAIVRDTRNKQMNYSSAPDPRMRQQENQVDRKNRDELAHIVATTNPSDAASLMQAINALNGLQNTYDLKGSFFASLRAKVPFGARAQYVRN